MPCSEIQPKLGPKMENSTRRDHLKQLGGLFAGSIASSAALNSAAQAQSSVVPPEGIGYKINHLSYSDLGGRPDSVQVMKNKGHIYVGHMHSDGVTILNAANPKDLKPKAARQLALDLQIRMLDLENCLDKRIDHIEKRISKIDFVFENPKLTIGGIAILVMVAIAFINMEINYKVGNTLDPIANSLFFLRDKNEKQVFRGDNPKNYLNQKDTIK